MTRLALIGACWLVVQALPLSAQVPDASAKTGTITVTGTRLSLAEARVKATDFVRSMGIRQGETPLARWVDPICPHALDLSEVHARMVEARVRAIATSAHVPVASIPCRPNIVIGFVSDGAALVREIVRRSPRSLAEAEAGDRSTLVNGTAPVRWWYATATTGSDGERMANDAPAAAMGHNMGGNNADIPLGTDGALSTYRSGLIATEAVRVIRNATVVVDISRSQGKSLAAVIDYAAMVALVEIRPRTPPPAGSVLALFAADPEPEGLTSQDRSLLSALYRIPLNRMARQQRSLLINYTADRLRGATGF